MREALTGSGSHAAECGVRYQTGRGYLVLAERRRGDLVSSLCHSHALGTEAARELLERFDHLRPNVQ